MAYGVSLEEVRKINEPSPLITPWGAVTSLTEMPDYAMYRVDLAANSAQPLHFFASEFHAFVESGDVVIRSLDPDGSIQFARLSSGHGMHIPRLFIHGFSSFSGAVLYFFGPRTRDGIEQHLAETHAHAQIAISQLNPRHITPIGHATTDVRNKYWGRIETILDGDIAAKRLFIQKGGSGSLEFHVDKRESYYIHSGLIRVGLRTGRAVNHSIILGPGQGYDIRPGVMHLREGLEDSVILEVSTRDSDRDSYLVEDGQTYRHIDTAVQL
jgi:mannose-6-phosphate isomerase-like protein (cupin superfamily)